MQPKMNSSEGSGGGGDVGRGDAHTTDQYTYPLYLGHYKTNKLCMCIFVVVVCWDFFGKVAKEMAVWSKIQNPEAAFSRE